MIRMVLLLSAVLFALGTSGCGTSAVEYTVKRAAPINLKGHKRVAVGDFRGYDGGHADLVANDLAQQLLDSGEFEKVVNREYLDDVLGEHKLQLAGITDSKTLNRIGKISGASIIIYGTLDNDNYKEDVSRKIEIVTNVKTETVLSNYHHVEVKTVAVETNRIFIRKGYYNLAVTYQIVDVETAELILVKRFSASRTEERKGINEHPAPIDEGGLFYGCVSAVSSDLVRQMTPYYERVRAEFQLDNDLPEVDTAVQKLRAGFYDESLQIFTGMTNNTKLQPKVRAKTVYNLGVMHFLLKHYGDAEKLIQLAISMNPDASLYDWELDLVRREADNDKRLKEQE